MKLLHGDCLELMKTIPDKSIDLVLTDPPYGTTACKWDTVIPFEPMWKELKRVRKPNGAIALFGTEPFSSNLRMSNIKEFKYDWYWNKNCGGGFLHAKRRPLPRCEIISLFYKKLPNYYPIFEEYAQATIERKKQGKDGIQPNTVTNRIYGVKSVSRIINLDRGKYPSNVKFFKNSSKIEKIHPTQKPVALLEYLIKTYTLEGETVLDFTMGSGSTGVACKNLNRKFIGIEKDDKYFEIAKKRILGSPDETAITK